MDEDYRGYNLSIASERGGHKPELCVFDEDGNIVSEQFTCFKGGMIIPSVENIRIILNEIDEKVLRKMGKPYFPCTVNFEFEPPTSESVWVCEDCVPITKNTIVLTWYATNTKGISFGYKLNDIRPAAYGKESCDICGK
jgi:hypothetical protein